MATRAPAASPVAAPAQAPAANGGRTPAVAPAAAPAANRPAPAPAVVVPAPAPIVASPPPQVQAPAPIPAAVIPQTHAPVAAPAPVIPQALPTAAALQPVHSSVPATSTSQPPSLSSSAPSYSLISQTIPPAQANANAPSSSTGNSNFPTAAVASVSIVGGLAVLFALWRLYRWRARRRANQLTVFPIGDEETYERKSMVFSPTSAVPFLGHTDSFGGYSDDAGSLKVANGTSRRSLSIDEIAPAVERPILPHALSTDQLRQQGSRHSFSAHPSPSPTLRSLPSRQSFNGSLYTGMASHRQSFGAQSRPRVSGAPHSIHSRVEISVPQPLAGPPASIVAHDSSHLDFAANTGMGTGSLGNMQISPASMQMPRPRPVSQQWQGDAAKRGSGGISAAQRAAYLAHGNRASMMSGRDSSRDRTSMAGSSSPDDFSSSEDMGGRRAPSRTRMSNATPDVLSRDSSSSGATPEHDPGHFTAPRQQLEELLGGR